MGDQQCTAGQEPQSLSWGLEAPTYPCPLKLEDFFVETNLLPQGLTPNLRARDHASRLHFLWEVALGLQSLQAFLQALLPVLLSWLFFQCVCPGMF